MPANSDLHFYSPCIRAVTRFCLYILITSSRLQTGHCIHYRNSLIQFLGISQVIISEGTESKWIFNNGFRRSQDSYNETKSSDQPKYFENVSPDSSKSKTTNKTSNFVFGFHISGEMVENKSSLLNDTISSGQFTENKSSLLNDTISSGQFTENKSSLLNDTIPGHGSTWAMTSEGEDATTLSTLKVKAPTTIQGHDNRLSSKSDAYIAVIQSLPSLVSHIHQLKYRSCRDRCGVSYECSCKPICQILKTCCYDFLEECGNGYDRNQFLEMYGELRSMDTECTLPGLIVSKCFHRRNLRQDHNNHKSVHKLNTFSHVTKSDLGNDRNKVHNSTLKNLFYILSSLSGVDPDLLSDVEQLLISLPLIDTSTGISYKNISIYNCNGALWINAKFWEFLLHAQPFPSIAKVRTMDDVSSLLNFSENCLVFPDKEFNTNLESCHPDAIDSCPKDFHDNDVIEACRDVNFFLEAITQRDQIQTKMIIKNPFCLYCNLGGLDELKDLNAFSLDSMHKKTSCLKHDLLFNINPLRYNHEMWMENGIILSGLHQVHYSISCNFLVPRHFIGQQSNFHSLPDEAVSNKSHILKTTCKSKTCLFNSCHQYYRIMMGLPPAKTELTDSYINYFSETWRRVLLQLLQSVDNVTEFDDLQYYRLTNLHEKVERDYSYVIRAHFNVDITELPVATNDILTYLVPAVLDLVNMTAFPFQNDKRYLLIYETIYGSHYDNTMAGFNNRIIFIPGGSSNTCPSNYRMTSCIICSSVRHLVMTSFLVLLAGVVA